MECAFDAFRGNVDMTVGFERSSSYPEYVLFDNPLNKKLRNLVEEFRHLNLEPTGLESGRDKERRPGPE